MMFYSQHKCPLSKGNYRQGEGSKKQYRNIKPWQCKKSSSRGRKQGNCILESIEEESGYQLLRGTCCEHTAVARESRKKGKVFSSNVLVIWQQILKPSASWALIQRMNKPGIQRSCSVHETLNKFHFCQNCAAAVQMVIITPQQQAGGSLCTTRFSIHWLPDMSLSSASVLTGTFRRTDRTD